MLLQLHRDFVVADHSNLDDLDLIVLPSQKTLSISDAERLQKWVSEGGKLIVFEKGAMLMGSEQFGIDLGAQSNGITSLCSVNIISARVVC
jgi:hypothetical protein